MTNIDQSYKIQNGHFLCTRLLGGLKSLTKKAQNIVKSSTKSHRARQLTNLAFDSRMMNVFNNLLFYFDKRLGVAWLLTLGLEIQEKHKGICHK